MLKRFIAAIARLIGIDANKTGHLEKLISSLGGCVGIVAVGLLARHFHGNEDAAWIVASMGASSVLLFAVPHGPLSQPWPVLGGHLIAAAIGVTCAQFIPDKITAGAIAVGLSIGAMYYLRCIHPPGGATALTAILGGPGIQSLGYNYLLTPVLLNVVLLLSVAVIFNSLFPWRRYPVGLANYLQRRQHDRATRTGTDDALPTRENLESALKSMNKLLDVSEDDLEEIYRVAHQHQLASHLKPEDIRLGGHYSNGAHDARWQIRQVVDMPVEDSEDDLLIYKVVAGKERRSAGTASRADFARWARHEVFLNENSWQRVDNRPPDSA